VTNLVTVISDEFYCENWVEDKKVSKFGAPERSGEIILHFSSKHEEVRPVRRRIRSTENF
jgi:hypothetical protein